MTVAQVLLTLEDSERRRRYLNARATLEALLALGRAAGDQRERHGRDRRDPLRRQRPPRGARGADGGARLPGAAVGRRRALQRRPEPRSARALHRARCGSITPEIEAMAGRRPRRSARAAWRPRSWPRRSRSPPAATCASPPATIRTRCGASRRGPSAPGSCRSATPVAARKQWIAGTLRPAGALTIDAGRAARAARGQEPAARRRHRCARPLRARRHRERARGRRRRDRPRHRRLLGRRRGAHHGAPVLGDRGASSASAAATR